MMDESISIKNQNINKTEYPFMIAEIGLNHNKDFELIKKLIRKAKESGADAVKFQTYQSEQLLISSNNAFSLFKNLELSELDFIQIAQICEQEDIIFFSTPFSRECVDWLEKMDVPCYKIASMDCNYYELLTYIAEKGKPVILSTGMSSLGMIEKAVHSIEKTGNHKIILLHTVSKYPPQAFEMHLNFITQLQSLFQCPVGFSDHTTDQTMSIAAKALGAAVFEKHFTLDKNLEGPDHSISSTPEEFKQLRKSLNAVHEAMNGPNLKRDDMEIAKGARRSLYAAAELPKGSCLTKEMIKVVRPYNGTEPDNLQLFIGKTLKKDLKTDEALDFTCI